MSRDIFIQRCQGVTPEEVGALITALMQPEFKKGVSTNSNKRTERYEGNVMGARVNLSAMTMNPGSSWSETEYTLENLDWELSVMSGSMHPVRAERDRGTGKGRIGEKEVHLYHPIFEGDEDIYRHQMTILKLAAGMYL